MGKKKFDIWAGLGSLGESLGSLADYMEQLELKKQAQKLREEQLQALKDWREWQKTQPSQIDVLREKQKIAEELGEKAAEIVRDIFMSENVPPGTAPSYLTREGGSKLKQAENLAKLAALGITQKLPTYQHFQHGADVLYTIPLLGKTERMTVSPFREFKEGTVVVPTGEEAPILPQEWAIGMGAFHIPKTFKATEEKPEKPLVREFPTEEGDIASFQYNPRIGQWEPVPGLPQGVGRGTKKGPYSDVVEAMRVFNTINPKSVFGMRANPNLNFEDWYENQWPYSPMNPKRIPLQNPSPPPMEEETPIPPTAGPNMWQALAKKFQDFFERQAVGKPPAGKTGRRFDPIESLKERYKKPEDVARDNSLTYEEKRKILELLWPEGIPTGR